MGPKFSHKCSNKKEAERDCKQRREDNITMEAEFGVMQPQGEEFKLPSETRKSEEWFLP